VPNSAVVDGLVAWYRFEDSANTAIDATNALSVGGDQTAFDGSVNGASFVENGGVRDVVSGTGTNSGAYDFDGVDDIIDIGKPGFDVPENSCSFSFWLNVTKASGFRNILSKSDAFSNTAGRWKILLNENTNELQFQPSGGNARFLGISPSTGVFEHFVITQSATELKLYFNGSIDGTFSPISFANNKDARCLIGAVDQNGLNEFFGGGIDDVRIYNRVLSASEINQIYTNTDPDQ
jgi:hypothetical protein